MLFFILFFDFSLFFEEKKERKEGILRVVNPGQENIP
jgi:hypothetical protein